MLALLFGAAGAGGFSLVWMGPYEPAMRYPHVLWWQVGVAVACAAGAAFFWRRAWKEIADELSAPGR